MLLWKRYLIFKYVDDEEVGEIMEIDMTESDIKID